MEEGSWIARSVELMTADAVLAWVRAAIYLGVGLLLARVVSRTLIRVAGRHLDAQQAMLVRRIGFYLVLVLAGVSALRELGFDLTVLLGAAGILTVAIGFASQTSASNLISGLFLIGERPFAVGDVVRVGDVTGEVLSIDMLSVKLRTFENLMVRVPNETLVKSQLTNLTRFPIRRLDMQIGVAYHADIVRVREILTDVADREPLCLEEPRPLFIFLEFGDSALKLQFSVWAKRENFLDLRNRMHIAVKKAFDDAGIEIPFPQRTLGSLTGAPFPVRVVSGDEPAPGPEVPPVDNTPGNS
ncbi:MULTISPECIES: mechanosensitive ion channel family protein [unclassified Thioalkalivibrio]|uniref:mechanosensitive ion channel family protein n=1 Tax=unclassified Thioalkalivibrio TaxID=2621013 RepID=UPI000380EBA9|nr:MULTISPECIES: mechanosensitive ion channel family protein [unclassified Thioalkalivibrio]